MALAAAASSVVIAKGKKVVTFSMQKDRPDDDTLLAVGCKRAPSEKFECKPDYQAIAVQATEG